MQNILETGEVVGGTASKWDLRFLRLAYEISTWSKDPSTQTGAVIVRPNGTIAGTGFNGFPRGMSDSASLYLNRETKYERVIHCEMNAVLSAGEFVEGYTLFTVPFLSCPRCGVHMIQAGITTFVAPTCPPDKLERWGEALGRTQALILEAGRWTRLIDVNDDGCQSGTYV